MRAAGLILLAFFTATIGAVYGWSLLTDSAPAWSPWALGLAVPATMVSAILIGVSPRASRTAKLRAGVAAALTLLLLASGFVLALALSGAGEPLVLGLPRRAAIIMYGVGLLPFLVVPVAYALAFEDGAPGTETESGAGRGIDRATGVERE